MVAVAPSMPCMWSAVSVTSEPIGYSGSAASVIPSGTGPPSAGCSISPWLPPCSSCCADGDESAVSWSLAHPVSARAPPSAAMVMLSRRCLFIWVFLSFSGGTPLSGGSAGVDTAPILFCGGYGIRYRRWLGGVGVLLRVRVEERAAGRAAEPVPLTLVVAVEPGGLSV